MDIPSADYSTSPASDLDDTEDFIFVETDDLDVEIEPEAPPPPPAVIAALTKVASRDRLLVTGITKSVITGAASTLSTGTVAGVPSVAMGALIAGGLIALKTLKKRSAQSVIRNLDQEQQTQLIRRIGAAVKDLGIKDMAKEILQRRDVKDVALNIVSSFLTEKYGLQLTRI